MQCDGTAIGESIVPFFFWASKRDVNRRCHAEPVTEISEMKLDADSWVDRDQRYSVCGLPRPLFRQTHGAKKGNDNVRPRAPELYYPDSVKGNRSTGCFSIYEATHFTCFVDARQVDRSLGSLDVRCLLSPPRDTGRQAFVSPLCFFTSHGCVSVCFPLTVCGHDLHHYSRKSEGPCCSKFS